MNKQLERIEVLEPCLRLCKKLKDGGAILQYKRLDALDAWHYVGSPDIEIWVPKDSLVHIIMAECKRPNGGSLRNTQILYRDKYKSFKNVVYSEIRSPMELKKLVFSISDSNMDYEIFDEFVRSSL